MSSSAAPTRASLRDLLADLLGARVRVDAGALQQLLEGRPAYAATYRRDEGSVSALGVSDLGLAVACGSAIGMTPPAEAEEALAQAGGRLEGDLLDFFHEVANVTAKLLNGPTKPHVLLTELHAIPGEVPAEVAELALEPGARVDYLITVEGYGSGTLTFLCA